MSDPLAAPHALATGEVVGRLRADADRGLPWEEARARLARSGPNRLPVEPPPTRLTLFGHQLANSVVLLLVAAAAVSLAIGELIDAAVIMAIVVANAALGYVQEGRAETAARGLRALMAPRALALRGGVPVEIDADELVAGDVVILHAGDRVPADGRLLDALHIEVDESVLTGESVPIGKRADPPVAADAPLAERETMAYAGTTVARGAGRLVVTATGTGTEVGKIAETAARIKPERTPLQARLDRLAGFLLRAAGSVCVVLALVAYLYGEDLGQSLLIGVSLAVAAVPEGLPAVVTIVLAIGMRRIAEHGAIVRRLQAVETLGSTSVICADKTGTLTENRMTVGRAYPCDTDRDIALDVAGPAAGAHELLEAALLACDPETAAGPAAGAPGTATESGPGEPFLGEPTEAAIVRAALAHGVSRSAALAGRQVVEVEPFDPERKRMSVVVEDGAGARTAFVKGAPETLLPRLAEGAGDPTRIAEVADRWAADGMRVLMVASRPEVGAGEDPEADLRPLGLLGLADPPRPASRPSVEEARRAGIRTLMVTGDHPQTALAIARATTIVGDEGPERVLTGSDVDRLSDEDLRVRARGVDVYARVAPAHKLRIVEALKRDGEVVAMTGDGVNDVPALRAAHIGVAMGRRGSDAAVAISDMVLTDDEYATIVHAVRRGRTIYNNIVRFVHFLLAANAGEILVFAVAIGLGMSAPLTVLQILVVNLLTDGLPAVALGVDPASPGVMRRPPRPLRESILLPIRGRLIVGGLAMGAAAFAAFLIGEGTSHAAGQTMAFTTLVFAQLAHVFAIRGNDWFYRAGRNPFLIGSVALSAVIQVVVLAVPAVAAGFDVVSMTAGQLAAALALSFVPFAAVEAFKAWQRKRQIHVSAA